MLYDAPTPPADTPSPQPAGPPPQVVMAFHAEPRTRGQVLVPERLGSHWDYGWKVGNVVFAPVVGEHEAWSARVRERLDARGVLVARPVRSSDGRVTVAGWRATSFVPGRPEARIDETVAAALRLGQALAQVREWPTMNMDDPLARADRAAWELGMLPASPVLAGQVPLQSELEDGVDVDLLRLLAEVVRPLPHEVGPNTVCHAAMVATTIYQGILPPAVTDIVGVVRPRDYTAALAIVDGLLSDSVDSGIIARFDHVPGLVQLVVRACAYRVYANALLEHTAANMVAKLDRVARVVVAQASANI